MTGNTDPRDIYGRALDQTEAVAANVRPDQLDQPTPCTEFDVRALLGHLAGAMRRHAVTGEGGDGMAVSPQTDGVPDSEWTQTIHEGAGRCRRAWADEAKLDAIFEVPWGKVPGRGAVSGYVQEMVMHSWDLAKATGQPTELDPALAEYALAVAQRVLPPEIRGQEGIPFGTVVPVPETAGPYERLAGWLGRAV